MSELSEARRRFASGDAHRGRRQLERVRRRALSARDVGCLYDALRLADELGAAAADLAGAIREDIRFLTRRAALGAGLEWHDPFPPPAPRSALVAPLPAQPRSRLVTAAAAVVFAAAAAAVGVLVVPGAVHWWRCSSGVVGAPTWSPDGRRIAFAQKSACDTRIFVVDADGANLHAITTGRGDDLPAWSPDGDEILFDGHGCFCIVRPDGRVREIVVGQSSASAARGRPTGPRSRTRTGSCPVRAAISRRASTPCAAMAAACGGSRGTS